METTEIPINITTLDELIKQSCFEVDVMLSYDEESDSYEIFVKYNEGNIIRQVYTQRNTPRNFKNLDRAVAWGKSMGFKSLCLNLDYKIFRE